MKKVLIQTIILLLLFQSSFSQETNYSVSLIPDSLKENADVVIRYNLQSLSIDDASSAVLKIKEVKTILKKSGEEHAFLIVPYSKFIKVKYVRGRIYDKNGKLIRKIKPKDIIDISYYDGFSLYTDNRLKAIKKPAVNPPYTVEYEYGLNFKGILSFPAWQPVPSYRVAVQKSKLLISAPKNFRFRTKSYNYFGKKTTNEIKSNINYIWDIKNFKAVEKEPFNNSIKNLVPYVLVAPSDFELDNYKGNADTWGNFGAWINKLNTGRNTLPDETIKTIIELTKNANSEKEKAKIIYEFMQSKTRYVNIALGIGGWQPVKAEDTDETGYGDCKALSFYTKSLLEAVGIKSHYVIVEAGKNAPLLRADFPSIQFNHAILCVPFNKDTVWLDCTSQTIPFGYIGKFTDDRDVLIIDSDGKGKIAHTTIYPEEVNSQTRTANLILDEQGNLSADIKTIYSGLQYENVNRLLVLSEEDQKKKIIKRISIPNMKLQSFSFKENKDVIPSIEENLSMNIQKYASISSGRIFITANILNRNEYIPKSLEKRKTEIVFRRGYIDIDTINYTIPEHYVSEFIPESVNEVTKFGSYSVKTNLINNKLVFVRKLIFHKGKYSPEDYEELRDFYKLIYKNDKQTVVLLKEE